jgi:hypothetical protein
LNSPFWLQAGTAPHYHLSVALRASYHSVRLFLARKPAIRRKLIDQVRRCGWKRAERWPRQTHQRTPGQWTWSSGAILGRYRTKSGNRAPTPGRCARERYARRAEPADRPGTGRPACAGGDVSSRCPTGLAAQQPAQDIADPSARIARSHSAARGKRDWPGRVVGSNRLTASAFERLVSEETQERHHDRRHSASFTTTAINTAGLALAPRAILHAIEDIEQSHVFIPLRPPPSARLCRCHETLARRSTVRTHCGHRGDDQLP